MSYIEGYVVPIKPGRKDDYIAMAQMFAPAALRNGALRVVEAWNDTLPVGKVNDMRTAVLAEDGEDVVFSWIEWPDKATRDAAWEAIMADETMKPPADDPMAGARLIHGGFSVILDTSAQ